MNRAYLLIIIAAILWGTIAFYVKQLYALGFTPMEVVTIRVCAAACLLIFYLALRAPSQMKLHSLHHVKYFIGTGIFSIIFFNFSLFKTIEIGTIPIAYALLYTAPAFVIILSFLFFQERITRAKLIALIFTLFGVICVVELNPFDFASIHLPVFLFGLGAGLGYALYSIFSKYALAHYSSLQITTFTFVVSGCVLAPVFLFNGKIESLIQVNVLIYVIGIGLLPTAVAYVIYTLGLQQTEASKASILATIEPIVATLIGICIFSEAFHFIQIIGMGSIIFAVIIIQWSEGKTYETNNRRYLDM